MAASRFPRGRRRHTPCLEPLESRHAPACTVSLNTSLMQLQIVCDGSADRVTLDHSGTNTTVTVQTPPLPPQTTTWSDGRFRTIQVLGQGGDDRVDVLANAHPTNVNTGAGRNAVHVGRAGSTQGVQGVVDVRSAGGTATLDVNGAADRLPQTVQVTARGVTGLARAPITFTQEELASLTLHGGVAGNLFTLTDTPRVPTMLRSGAGEDVVRVQAVAPVGSLTVQGQAGDDTVHLGSTANSLATLQAPVTVQGQAGADVLNLFDQGTSTGQDYELTATTLRRGRQALLRFDTVETLGAWASAGADDFTVAAVGRGTRAFLRLGDGDDRFLMGTRDVPLDECDGEVTADGGRGRNQMALLDQEPGGVSYTIDTSTIDRPGSCAITLDGFSAWLFHAANGDDQFHILGIIAGVTVTLHLADGNDTLFGPDTVNAWELTGPNDGTLNDNVTFTSVENLVGGAAADTFGFGDGQAGQGVTGNIDGGGGVNALTYAAFSAAVEVNLTLATATAVGGIVTRVQNATGGLGPDILMGDNAANVLSGGAGRDLLLGGGDDYASLNPDTLDGGGDQDILIAGYSWHSYDTATLILIRAEWVRLDLDYTERFNSLYAGGTVPALNEATVFWNYSVYGGGLNALAGGAGDLDLFFFGDAGELGDLEDGEVAVQIF